jgi:OOP family OmpA-OmpF porin
MGLIAARGVVSAQAAQEEVPHATIYPVSFPMGSIELHQADHETIHGVAAMMERNPALNATVVGKADTVGSADYNEHLSWRRAAAVFEALVYKYNVPATRVEMRWTGERLPVVPTGDETAELQNRVSNIIVR